MYAGIVDQAIDAPETFCDVFDRRPQLLMFGDVADEERRVSWTCVRQLGCKRFCRLRVTIENRDVSTLATKYPTASRPDPLRTACDDDDTV